MQVPHLTDPASLALPKPFRFRPIHDYAKASVVISRVAEYLPKIIRLELHVILDLEEDLSSLIVVSHSFPESGLRHHGGNDVSSLDRVSIRFQLRICQFARE